MSDTQIIVLMVGWYASMMVSAYWWGRHWFLRYLPISYGVVSGVLIASVFGSSGVQVVEDLLVGLGGGVLLWFIVWIEAPRSKSTEKDRAA